MSSPSARASAKATALRTFVVSVGVTALLGIWALLAGDFDELQIKVLLSSLSVSAASLCALAGAASLERAGRRLPLAMAAILLSGLGLLLCLSGLWGETDDEAFWKLTAIVCFFAVGSAHATVLRQARLLPRYRWVGDGTVVLVLSLAAYASGLVLAEPHDDYLLRALAALSILVAAGTVATPVLHRLSRDEFAAADGGADDRAVDMLCPACGARQRAALGAVRCRACRARFRIELLPPED